MSLLSFRQYAKHRGVSPEAVSKAVESGRISTINQDGKRLIDPERADAEWAANTQSMKRHVPTKAEKAERKTAPSESQDDPALSKVLQGPSYAQSRAIREAYAARLAKIEYEERTQKLVAVDSVKVEAFKVGRTIRDAILNIPDRISNELAGYGDDPAKIHERLTQELILALEELVNAGKRGF